MIKVGSIVELVNDNWGAKYDDGVVYPIKGKQYTVRSIEKSKHGTCILLEEIVNNRQVFYEGYLEPAFFITRFRELLPPIENIEEHINQNSLEYAD
jgi:hypothetical protein